MLNAFFRSLFGLVLLAVLLSPALVYAGPVIYVRDLPDSSNTNYKTGTANLTNYAYGPGYDTNTGNRVVLGDDFILGASPTGSWLVDSVSVWIVSNIEGGTTPPATEFSSISLYTGQDHSFDAVPTPTVLSLASSSYTASRVYYLPNGEDYRGQDSLWYPIYKLTFGGLSLVVPQGVLWDFAVDATGTHPLNLHSTNHGGTPTPPWDGFFLGFEGSPLNLMWVYDSSNFGPLINPLTGAEGIYNPSDINVEIDGVPTPEPASFALLGLGLSTLAALSKRR